MKINEMVKKKTNKEKFIEIIIKVSICIIAIISSLYYIFPIFLNYPKNALEEEFQRKIVGISYNIQFRNIFNKYVYDYNKYNHSFIYTYKY